MPTETAEAPVIEQAAGSSSIPPEAVAALDEIALRVFGGNASPVAPPAEPARDTTPTQKAAGPESAPAPVATPAVKAEPTGIPLDLLAVKEEVAAAPEKTEEVFAFEKHLKDPKTIESVGQLKKLYEERGRTIQSLEAKAKDLEQRTQQVDPNQQALIEQLKAQNAEMASAFERVNLEANPRFQNQFVKPISQASDRARTLLKDSGLDSDLFDRTMALTGKARIEALDDLSESIQSPSVRTQVLNLVSTIDGMEAQKRDVLSNVKENAARLQQEERARYAVEMQQSEKRLTGILEQATTHLRDKAGFEFLKKSDSPGAEEWNKKVDQIHATAADILLRNTDEMQAAAAAVLAAQAPHYRAAFIAERTARLEAQKELAAIKGAEPGLESGGRTMAGEIEPPRTLDDLVRRGLGSLNGSS